MAQTFGASLPFGCSQEQTKTTDYTVLAADSGTLFQKTTGAATFTLPAVAAGLWFVFHNNHDSNMLITRNGADTAVSDGAAAATTLTYSAPNHKVGATCLVKANAAGTAWEFYDLNQAAHAGSGTVLPYGCTQEVTKTGTAYTVVAADGGTLFHTNSSGAFTYTLPAVAAGLWFVFHNIVDQNMIVTRAGADTGIADGNAAAISLTYSTASHKIGSACLVKANAAGTGWEFYNLNVGCTATVG